MSDAQAKAALVTGAARGIGAAIVARLAESGWRVTASDVDGSALEGPGARWRRGGIDVRTARVDVTDRSAVAALMADHPPFDVVVNNAGVQADMLPFADLAPEQVARMLRINVMGVFVVAQEAARRMAGGAIVNIASRGYLGGIGGAHYVASKAAVVGMTRATAVELRWRGIAVNAVAPGMVETRMITGFSPDMRDRLIELEPGGAPMAPELIAGAVAFLASPEGRAMSGQVLLVDGGKAAGVGPY